MRRVWAIALNTIRQALRMKVAAVFVVLLLILLPVMGLTMTGDGTLKGRCQSFVSYSLSLVAFLLSLLSVMVSTYSVSSDIQQKQIYTVVTKPVNRSQILLGKLVGVVLLNAILLTIFAVVIYGITVSMPRFFDATDEQVAVLNNEFFTARAGLVPAEPDVTEQALQTYERLEKAGKLPANVETNKIARDNYIKALAERIKLGKRAAGSGRELIWEFNNVKPLDSEQSLFVRFKYDVSANPPDLNIRSKWIVGDYRQLRYGQSLETPIYSFDRKDLIRTFYEIEVPANAIAADDYLAVGFLNLPMNNTVVIFPPEDGMEVLYKADTFGANFFRAVVLVFFRLVFLSCLGVFTSSFLSFPVAVLLCMAVLFTGTISGFIINSFNYLGENLGMVYSYSVKPLMYLLPRFDKANPSDYLIDGRLLSWWALTRFAVIMVFIKSGILLLFSLLIFRRREVAKISV